MQKKLLPLLESAEVNHKVRSLSRDRNPTTCDLNVPGASAFQNTYSLLPPDCSLQQSLLELIAGLEKHWPLFQIPGLQH